MDIKKYHDALTPFFKDKESNFRFLYKDIFLDIFEKNVEKKNLSFNKPNIFRSSLLLLYGACLFFPIKNFFASHQKTPLPSPKNSLLFYVKKSHYRQPYQNFYFEALFQEIKDQESIRLISPDSDIPDTREKLPFMTRWIPIPILLKYYFELIKKIFYFPLLIITIKNLSLPHRDIKREIYRLFFESSFIKLKIQIISSVLHNIKKLILINEYGRTEFMLILAAKSLNIPVISLQHGFISEKTHFGYNYQKYYPQNNPILPDQICVYSEYYKKILINCNWPESNIQVTGAPWYDQIYNNYHLKPKSTEIINILWTTQALSLSKAENLSLCQIFNNLIINNPQLFLTIKLHPGDSKFLVFFKKHFARLIKNKRIRILENNQNIFDLIKQSDILITKNSTTAIEAIMLKCPVILLTTSNQNLKNYYNDPVFHYAYNMTELTQIINQDYKHKIKKHRANFISKYCLFDGENTKRIYQIILK